MPRQYHEWLPYAFKRFSIQSAFRTALPTANYYLTRPALPPSEKPALFTMNILPPMMTVWYHLVQKYVGDKVDITIFDCSGKLNAKEFPQANVYKFLNFYAATKSDEFLYHIAKNRKIGWICDDDMFPLSSKMVDVLEEQFANPKTASISFRSRKWWYFDTDGKHYEPSSSYCTAFNRDIFVEKEHLSLAPANGNEHPSLIGKPPKRYDTFDKANEILLRKGYDCFVVPEKEQEEYLTGFTGMSGAVMLLYIFKTPEAILDFYNAPPKEQWSGNVLFGTLSAMLSICTICELYKEITGMEYPMPSLPSRSVLEKLMENHKKYFREDQDSLFHEQVSDRLRVAL